MATNWLVVELNDMEDGGIATLLPSEGSVEEHIATRIDGGADPGRLRLFAAAETPFGVAYQTIISVGGKTAAATKSTAAPKNGAQAKASVEADKEPAGTQDGVRFSEMFKAS